MLGKLIVKTGKSNIHTVLQTPTANCALRGTVVTLSIDAEGQPYILFSEAGAAFSIGDFISGIAANVPLSQADQNPVQRAAFVARAAADEAINRTEELQREAIDKGASGPSPKAPESPRPMSLLKIRFSIRK